MADTVWFQIVALFDGFFRSMSLFVVFTVFTSLMSLFLVISFQTPLKNPTRRVGGTKPEALVGYKAFLSGSTVSLSVYCCPLESCINFLNCMMSMMLPLLQEKGIMTSQSLNSC